jgi:polyhydroxyalkanoate synthesis regulator phasin
MGKVLKSRGLSLDKANNELSQLLKATDHTEAPVENKLSTESPELTLIRKLFNMMDNLNQALHSFIQESRSEYTSLRDELQCIKKFESINAEKNVSNFEHTAEKKENAIQRSINSTQKKFQSIYDLLKASTSKQPSPAAAFG